MGKATRGASGGALGVSKRPAVYYSGVRVPYVPYRRPPLLWVGGNDHAEYRRLEDAGWERHERRAVSMTQNAALTSERERTEILWVKRRGESALALWN
jgi:hypothetical protein